MSPYYYERPRIFYTKLKKPIGRHSTVRRHRLERDFHRSFTMQYLYHHKAEVFQGWMLYHKYKGTNTLMGGLLWRM